MVILIKRIENMGSLIKKGVVIEVLFRSKLTTGELYISQRIVEGRTFRGNEGHCGRP